MQNVKISLITSMKEIIANDCKAANPEHVLVVGNHAGKLILQVYIEPINC